MLCGHQWSTWGAWEDLAEKGLSCAMRSGVLVWTSTRSLRPGGACVFPEMMLYFPPPVSLLTKGYWLVICGSETRRFSLVTSKYGAKLLANKYNVLFKNLKKKKKLDFLKKKKTTDALWLVSGTHSQMCLFHTADKKAFTPLCHNYFLETCYKS